MIADTNVPASPNDIQTEKVIPPSGILSLTQAVAMATAHNREYLRQKEQLYLIALDLTLARHQFARQWFGTIDASYVRNSEMKASIPTHDSASTSCWQMVHR